MSDLLDERLVWLASHWLEVASTDQMQRWKEEVPSEYDPEEYEAMKLLLERIETAEQFRVWMQFLATPFERGVLIGCYGLLAESLQSSDPDPALLAAVTEAWRQQTPVHIVLRQMLIEFRPDEQ